MFMIVPVLIPLVFGAILLVHPISDRSLRERYVGLVSVVNTIALVACIIQYYGTSFEYVAFSDNMSFTFSIDVLSVVFSLVLSVLWIPATYYALEYMKHEGSESTFFGFFLMSFGVVVGVAFSGNLITMYLFYELLTLVTLPLVMHGMSPRALFAGKRYLIFSFTGASLGFIAIMIILYIGMPLSFSLGGWTHLQNTSEINLIYIAYILAFFGFGVKAGVFPFHIWLPSAGVAPTPVTALLHAVAVVNAGVFAVTRATYYSFGTLMLRGTYSQYITMAFAITGIVFGSAVALRATHIKQRLAYSTVSNLSYMLFSITIMSTDGLKGVIYHMTYHSVLKIVLFFVAGILLYKTNREYVREVRGLGKKLPITFICFTICSLGLIGIPPFTGFYSKWMIAKAAVESGFSLSFVGVFALIISALLTCMYLFTIIIPAYCRPLELKEGQKEEDLKDPNLYMIIPLVFITVVSVLLAFKPGIVFDIIGILSKGGGVL